jgi:hypothetical protein
VECLPNPSCFRQHLASRPVSIRKVRSPSIKCHQSSFLSEFFELEMAIRELCFFVLMNGLSSSSFGRTQGELKKANSASCSGATRCLSFRKILPICRTFMSIVLYQVRITYLYEVSYGIVYTRIIELGVCKSPTCAISRYGPRPFIRKKGICYFSDGHAMRSARYVYEHSIQTYTYVYSERMIDIFPSVVVAASVCRAGKPLRLLEEGRKAFDLSIQHCTAFIDTSCTDKRDICFSTAGSI